jgi:DNA-directed RNA polymerase specialized sigma24 family protein
MPKINYQFSDGYYEEIEVTEEFAQAYEEIDKQTKRNDKKFDWRTRNKESSLEKLHDECGFELQDLSVSVTEQAERADFIERFMRLLTEKQKAVFCKVYIENKPLRLTAQELGVHLKSVQKHVLLDRLFLYDNIQSMVAVDIHNRYCDID